MNGIYLFVLLFAVKNFNYNLKVYVAVTSTMKNNK